MGKTNSLNSLTNKPAVHIIETIIILLTALISLGVIVGWSIENIHILSIIPNSSTMKFNTALVFLFSSINVILLKIKKEDLSATIIYNTLAVTITIIGFVTLLEYIGISFIEIDNIIIEDTLSQNTPGRMSPATAFCSLLLGVSFLGCCLSDKSMINKISIVSLKIIPIISLIAIIGFILLIPSVSKTSFFQTMAIHTSVLFLLISTTLGLKIKNNNYLKIIAGNHSGSKIMRKLIPVITILPIILGFLLLYAVNNDIVHLEFGVTSYTVTLIILSFMYIMSLSLNLNKKDDEKLQLEKKLKQTNKELLLFQRGLNKISLIARTNSKGKITYVNDLFCDKSKYTKEEIIGSTHSIVNSNYHKPSYFKKMWETVLDGEIWQGDIKNKAKNGQLYWTKTTIIPFKDKKGKIDHFLSTAQDITSEKESEELLQSSYVKKLEDKNKELEQFTYIASHDLQEPLKTIISFIDLLLDDNSYNFNETSIKSMKFIKDATARMSQLIKSLLDYGQIGQGNELSTVDLTALITYIKADLLKVIEETNTEITVKELPTINGYKTPLRLLFQNLIENSIKFRQDNTAPKIEISAKERKKDWVFAVKDNGIGIHENQKEKIFLIFQRLHGKEKYDGMGIGLAHCRKIIGLHDGKLWVESTPNKGSTFYFNLKK